MAQADFQIENGILLAYRGHAGDVPVPGDVTGIGRSAFRRCASLVSVTVPEGVTEIGDGAFAWCPELRTVSLPESLRRLGREAFSGCNRLEAVTIPGGVACIEEKAFAWCERLRSVTIMAGVTELGEAAFANCRALESLSLPAGLERIGAQAFSDCRALAELTLPDTLSTLGAECFSGCALERVTLPKSVRTAGPSSFAGCRDITVYDAIDPAGVRGHGYAMTALLGVIVRPPMRIGEPWLDHEITVRSADTDRVLRRVWMGTAPGDRHMQEMLLSAWGPGADFDPAALDQWFIDGGPEDGTYIPFALDRLRYPAGLTAAGTAGYGRYLARWSEQLLTLCMQAEDMAALALCEQAGAVTAENIDGLIACASREKGTQFVAHLLEYKARSFGAGGFSLALD